MEMIDGEGYAWVDGLRSSTYSGMPAIEQPEDDFVTMDGNKNDGFARITFVDSSIENNYLKSISTDYENDGLAELFNHRVREYNITVDKTTDEINVSAEAYSDFAIIEGVGTHHLNAGPNTITLAVSSRGGAVRNYTLIVTREYDDNTTELERIEIEGYDSIHMEPNKTTYEIELAYETIKANVVGVPYSRNATATVSGNDPLIYDEGTITIVVSQDGLEDTTYKLNAKVKSIIKKDYTDLKGT